MTVTTTLEHVIDIDASPETLYRLWTTNDGLCAWWGTSAVVDARPGGTVRVEFGDDFVMVGEFVELDPPTLIRFTFGWEGGQPPPGGSDVEVHLAARGTSTRVTVRHTGLPATVVGSHSDGWTHFLPRLRTTAET